jgi:hypothetical protein
MVGTIGICLIASKSLNKLSVLSIIEEVISAIAYQMESKANGYLTKYIEKALKSM